MVTESQQSAPSSSPGPAKEASKSFAWITILPTHCTEATHLASTLSPKKGPLAQWASSMRPFNLRLQAAREPAWDGRPEVPRMQDAASAREPAKPRRLHSEHEYTPAQLNFGNDLVMVPIQKNIPALQSCMTAGHFCKAFFAFSVSLLARAWALLAELVHHISCSQTKERQSGLGFRV